MRTTIDLPTPLLKQARRRAGESGTTLSLFVAEAVRTYLSAAREPEPRYGVVTFGKAGGKFPTAEEIREALDADDAEGVRLPRRKG